MTPYETYAANHSGRSWTHGTRYYAPYRQEWINIEGRKSSRVRDIDNYIDYINNEMDDGSSIITDTNPVSYTLTSGKDERVWLYRQDDSGHLAQYAHIHASHEFIGNKVVIQDNDVYVVHHYYNLAVKALKKIQILPEGLHSTYTRRRGFNRMIEKSLPGFDKLEPYEGIIFPSTTD